MEKKREFPEYLKQMRKSRHYKQDFVASHLHISRQTYSHYETGRIKPSVNVLYNLARFYGVSVEDLFSHMEICPLEQEIGDREAKKEEENSPEQEFFSCYQCLNEKNKEDILSIMKAIMQAELEKD